MPLKMKLIELIKNNIFLLLFFLVSVAYTYGVVNNLNSIIYLFKPFIVLSLAIYYVSNAYKINKTFLVALVFALLGDVCFNILTEQFFILAMSSFMVFNLLLLTIAANKAGIIRFKFVLMFTVPFILIFGYLLKNYLNDVGVISLLILIFGLIVILLGAFSSYAYFKNKNRATLFLFLGALAFAITSISKGLKQFTFIDDYDVKLINTSCYVISLFLFCQAMIVKEKVLMYKKSKELVY